MMQRRIFWDCELPETEDILEQRMSYQKMQQCRQVSNQSQYKPKSGANIVSTRALISGNAVKIKVDSSSASIH